MAALTTWLQENQLKCVTLLQFQYPRDGFGLRIMNISRAVISEFGGANNQNCFNVRIIQNVKRVLVSLTKSAPVSYSFFFRENKNNNVFFVDGLVCGGPSSIYGSE